MNAPTRILAIALAALLAGCSSAALFTDGALPERADLAGADWPRLVDTPEAPPAGTYTEDVPDPAEGVAAVVELSEAARSAAARAAALDEPVLTEADRRRLGR